MVTHREDWEGDIWTMECGVPLADRPVDSSSLAPTGVPRGGRPKPALAQLTPANFSLSSSATGETRLDGGNTGVAQDGH
uniref:SFRICE_009193 n=1 Tax=Spodoptera frugiperda TaxID=7108 RepID=A0A2H1WRU1_SPOFR